ncbi:methyltransferase [Saccharomonospora piscinae]|uniref:Methyltransferase n=2 Tax=Saccharomonospora piscinae TaxID=687388 RepID=A0A1V9ADM6_SACPI|nr:methyltransferase [Saccharomonospora piscinae]
MAMSRARPELDGDLVARLRAAGCVFAEDEARLLGQATSDSALRAVLVARRLAGEPLEHVLGWVAFGGRRLMVEPGVFVPRRRTEFLADQARALVRDGAVVVDLCCGSGAVAAAAADAARVRLYAADIDPVAVACARRNLAGTGAVVAEGDLDAPLPRSLRRRVDVLVANVPYVPSGAVASMPPEAREHEPRGTLDGGADGLDMVRRLVGAAPRWLASGGSVLFEIGADQAASAAEAVRCAGLVPQVRHCDEREATVVVGTTTD